MNVRIVFLLLPLSLASCGQGTGNSPDKSPPSKVTPRLVYSPPDGPQDLTLLEYTPLPAKVRVAWSEFNPGDLNGDGAVNGQDVFPLAVHFGLGLGDEGFDICADANNDERINGQDLFVIAANFQNRVDNYRFYGGGLENFTELATVDRPLEFDGCLPVYDYTHEELLLPLEYRVKAYDSIANSQGGFSNTASVDVTPRHDGHYEGEIHFFIVTGEVSFDVDFNLVSGHATILEYVMQMPGLVLGDGIQGILTIENPDNPEGPPLPIGQYEGTFNGDSVEGIWSVEFQEEGISGDWSAERT